VRCHCEELCDEAISEGEILNRKHQIPKEIQKSKVKNKNDKAQMSNQAQNPNHKSNRFWHLSIWISIVIWTLIFGFVSTSVGMLNEIGSWRLNFGV